MAQGGPPAAAATRWRALESLAGRDVSASHDPAAAQRRSPGAASHIVLTAHLVGDAASKAEISARRRRRPSAASPSHSAWPRGMPGSRAPSTKPAPPCAATARRRASSRNAAAHRRPADAHSGRPRELGLQLRRLSERGVPGRERTMRLVVLPQAIRVFVPPVGNFFVSLFKDTALASTISIAELMFRGQLIAANTFKYNAHRYGHVLHLPRPQRPGEPRRPLAAAKGAVRRGRPHLRLARRHPARRRGAGPGAGAVDARLRGPGAESRGGEPRAGGPAAPRLQGRDRRAAARRQNGAHEAPGGYAPGPARHASRCWPTSACSPCTTCSRSAPRRIWGCEHFGPQILVGDLVTEPLRQEDFHVHLPVGPGIRVMLDQDRLRAHARN